MTRPSRTVELAVAGNEASDLLPVRSAALLAAHGARRAFWTVLDEGPVERCLALLVERYDGGWVTHHVPMDAAGENGRTEDGEALARYDEWIYVLGSHFGSKRGPLRPRRAFVARFREADAVVPVPRLHVVRNQFRLHRAVNDAIVAAGIAVLPPGERVRHRFIVATLDRGTARAKTWVSRLAEHDLPLNVEAAAFTPTGTLLLGLRFPVTDRGEPIFVELADVAGMFDRRSWPRVVGAYVLTGVTGPGELTGFRALSARGDGWYDAVVGSIDALGKGSVLLDDHPGGGGVPSRHVRFRLPAGPVGPALAGPTVAESTVGGSAVGGSRVGGSTPDDSAAAGGGSAVAGEVVSDLAPLSNVEGLAEWDGFRYYVTDEDHRVALCIEAEQQPAKSDHPDGTLRG